MRHVIVVVGSDEQRRQAVPQVRLLDDESVRETTWYACRSQDDPKDLLDDSRSILARVVLLPLVAYRFYLLVQNTRLWAGKRPLVLVRGRSLSSRIAAYAGSWGGGDVVKGDLNDEPPLGPTRFILEANGKLCMRGEA
jgi:hypothetical protein